MAGSRDLGWGAVRRNPRSQTPPGRGVCGCKRMTMECVRGECLVVLGEMWDEDCARKTGAVPFLYSSFHPLWFPAIAVLLTRRRIGGADLGRVPIRPSSGIHTGRLSVAFRSPFGRLSAAGRHLQVMQPIAMPHYCRQTNAPTGLGSAPWTDINNCNKLDSNQPWSSAPISQLRMRVGAAVSLRPFLEPTTQNRALCEADSICACCRTQRSTHGLVMWW
ncbi:hypothetical protein BT67DRAFT_230936 [Trichocladium antarcticum]|uniref:Uncharacterized protein n=1 Tax=Trichocladium antarcticum TaxID=1450529 RepID=A0AAN6UNL7_9PEZI|nr:hypothetical protein BT67DRAFT_230936 [Trichocladium antarcticum]